MNIKETNKTMPTTNLAVNKPVVTYDSQEKKSKAVAKVYNNTQELPFRYLGYRDIPYLLNKYVTGTNALDYGCGTGISTQFLIDQKFKTIGIDISKAMLEQAQLHCRQATFYHNMDDAFFNLEAYDLIFSSFVLFEIGNEAYMLEYLNNASRMLKKNGIFLAVTGSQYMYTKDWFCFNNQYDENQNLKSGDKAKIFVPGVNIEFTDYYWTENNYRNFFEKSNLSLIEIYYPLGKPKESFLWREETSYSPFLILVAKLKS